MNHHKAIVLPARLVGVVPQGDEPPPAPLAVARPEPPADTGERERAAVRELLTRLADAVRQLAAAQRLPLDELRQVAVELGMAVAARLVYAKIGAGEFAIEQLVHGALERLPTPQPATVRLHPDDLALLRRRLGDVAPHAEMPVELQPDAGLSRGDCRVQAGELAVWSGLRRRLDEIRDLLLEGLPAPR